MGLVGIECGYGNDLELFPPGTTEEGTPCPTVPPTTDLPLIACPLGPDGAVVEISPFVCDGSQNLFAGPGVTEAFPL